MAKFTPGAIVSEIRNKIQIKTLKVTLDVMKTKIAQLERDVRLMDELKKEKLKLEVENKGLNIDNRIMKLQQNLENLFELACNALEDRRRSKSGMHTNGKTLPDSADDEATKRPDRATRPVSAGKQFFAQSEFRFVQSIAAAGASPANIDAPLDPPLTGLTPLRHR